jgi:hypothetical protein
MCAAELANAATPIMINRPNAERTATLRVSELLDAAEEPGVRFEAANGSLLGIVVVTQFDGTLICAIHAAYMIQQLMYREQSHAGYKRW